MLLLLLLKIYNDIMSKSCEERLITKEYIDIKLVTIAFFK